MVEISDRQNNLFSKAGGLPDAAELLRQDAALAPKGTGGSLTRIAEVTAEGLVNTPRGLYNAALYDIKHPLEIVKTVAGSAAMAATLKIVLPDSGPVGKFAGMAMGAWFVAGTAPAFLDAYGRGLRAQTWSQMHAAGQQWGDAAGRLAVNSALGSVGYKIGAGITGNILARQSFDNFADARQNFWDGAARRVNNWLGSDNAGSTTQRLSLRANFSANGDAPEIQEGMPSGAQVTSVSDSGAETSATVLLNSKASVLRMDRYIARMAQGQAPALSDEGDAYAQQFGAKPESLDALKTFAGQHNLNIAESDLRSGRVLLTGKKADFQKAFPVQSQGPDSVGGPDWHKSGVIDVPRELSGDVQFVFGPEESQTATPAAKPAYRFELDDTGKFVGKDPAVSVSTEPFVKPDGYLATDIARAQNFPLKTGGAGQNGAFISLGGGIDLADYNKFYAEHGLAQPNPLGIVLVDGAKNLPGNPLAGDIENALDAAQMQSIAPKAHVDMILGPNTDQGLIDVFERGVFQKNGEGARSVLSASWGLAENKQTPQAVNALSVIFRQAAIRGVQVVAGSGDSGARSHLPTMQPEYPAADPNVTGVGGLKMILNPDGTPKSAVAWDEGDASSSGGGVSKLFRRPWWQDEANIPNNPDTGLSGRGVPDISTNAAKSTGFPVRVGGKDLVIGGTSAGAPLYGGLLLNLNSELSSLGLKPVTPLNPWMYARGQSNIFHDITTGSNHGFEAGPGWDAVSGLGWVDGQAMLEAMKNRPSN